jgi:hypothetical protein
VVISNYQILSGLKVINFFVIWPHADTAGKRLHPILGG